MKSLDKNKYWKLEEEERTDIYTDPHPMDCGANDVYLTKENGKYILVICGEDTEVQNEEDIEREVYNHLENEIIVSDDEDLDSFIENTVDLYHEIDVDENWLKEKWQIYKVNKKESK